MAAAYRRELDFMLAVLDKLRIRAQVCEEDAPPAIVDCGLRALLGLEDDFIQTLLVRRMWNRDRTIYKIMDQFMCNYIYFRLPGTSAVIIGPYLTIDPSRETLLEQAERMGIQMQFLPQQADYYAGLPVYNDPSAILSVVYTFAEHLWGDASAFGAVDVNYEQLAHTRPAADAPIEQENILQQMKLMEDRYAYEAEMMDYVSRGLSNRVEIMLSSVSRLNYRQRLADPLRNMKNYCIVCNTLMRKAAQQGGVHPLHLDRTSSQYARAIEAAPTLDACGDLLTDMIRAYCRLVHNHKTSHYSATVQKVITYIDANLSGDLSLPTLSAQMAVSPGYLSTLFHRETGTALSEYILSLRMESALRLLSTTHLQVQTIAQLCGYGDPNYFGKLFRRRFGITALQYRSEQIRI